MSWKKLISPPQAWNVGTIAEAEADEMELKARPRATHIEVYPGPDDRVRIHTGKTEPAALIWSSIPDGQERLVGMLTPEDLKELLGAFGEEPPLTALVRGQRAEIERLEATLEETYDAIARVRSLHKRLTHTRRDGTVDEFCRECLDWPKFPCATLKELDKGREEWLDKLAGIEP